MSMTTFRIPNTDLEVSRLAYGTWHLGGSWDDVPLSAELKQRAFDLIHAAVDHGINHIDLADIYTKTKSDEAVGHVLAQSPGLRDKLVLQAKCGIILGDDPNPGDPPRYDFSYDNIVGSVENTLRLLGTDRVELLALHRPDPLVEPEEVARAFDHLYSSGKVRYFGLSNHNAGQIALLQRFVDQPFVLNQVELSLLHHHLISDGMVTNMTAQPYAAAIGTLDYCRLHDIMIQAWSPLARGTVFSHDSVGAELNAMAASHKTTPAAVALAWLLRHPAQIQPIIGTLNPTRISEQAPAANLSLSRVEWYRLLAAGREAGVP